MTVYTTRSRPRDRTDTETTHDHDQGTEQAAYNPADTDTDTEEETTDDGTLTITDTITTDAETGIDTPEQKRDAETQYANDHQAGRGVHAERVRACFSQRNVNGRANCTDVHGTWIKNPQTRAQSRNEEWESRDRRDKLFRHLRDVCGKLPLGHGVTERAGQILREARKSDREYPENYTGEAVLFVAIETALEDFNHPFPRDELKAELKPHDYSYDFDQKINELKDDLEDRDIHKRADHPGVAWVIELIDRLELHDHDDVNAADVRTTALHILSYAPEMAEQPESRTYGGTAPVNAAGAVYYALVLHDNDCYMNTERGRIRTPAFGYTQPDIASEANIKPNSVTCPADGYKSAIRDSNPADHVNEIAAVHRRDIPREAVNDAKTLVKYSDRASNSNPRALAGAALYHVLNTYPDYEYEYTSQTFGMHTSVKASSIRSLIDKNGHYSDRLLSFTDSLAKQ